MSLSATLALNDSVPFEKSTLRYTQFREFLIVFGNSSDDSDITKCRQQGVYCLKFICLFFLTTTVSLPEDTVKV